MAAIIRICEQRQECVTTISEIVDSTFKSLKKKKKIIQEPGVLVPLGTKCPHKDCVCPPTTSCH